MPWLMKAEPDSRVVKGKDVKFSVDDFEKLGVSPWDGVRNHEAKKIMKERMKLGDKVLFYHSNCKTPGVFAIAEIVKEGYPDYTAWDEKHPYYDAKTKKDDPTWFMVDVKFIERLPYPPTLSLIKHIATSTSLPDEISYIGQEGFDAIKSMQLVNRGRLSVQPVEQIAFDAIIQLGNKGGWDDLVDSKAKSKVKSKTESVETNSETKPNNPSAKQTKQKCIPTKPEPESSKDQISNKMDSKPTTDTTGKSISKLKKSPSDADLEGRRRSKRIKEHA